MLQIKPVSTNPDKRSLTFTTMQSASAERPKMLKIRSANQCLIEAQSKPIPQMLFGELWHEGEVCILFADSNVGKSLLAVQIANSISSGRPIPGFVLNARKQKVLYFDFELNDKQFQQRYSYNYDYLYDFDDQFNRVSVDPEFTDYEDFEKQLFVELEEAVNELDTKVLIIDNLTYLKTQATDTSKEALPLMKLLKKLAHKYSLSILVLAHTPKRNSCNPITMNDLAGSKMLSNFADSIFAIGASTRDKSLRYIKQIKARATEIIYDTGNVVLCELRKEYNFTAFHYISWTKEKDHLQEYSSEADDDFEKKVLELRQQNLPYSKIAEELGTNKMKVMRILKRNGYQE